MAAVKLKVKVEDTGQESLLLVTKLNLKGVLVETAHTLPVGASVRLSLQLRENEKPIDLKGEVYKVAAKPRGKQGMILRFLNPPKDALQAIRTYLGHNPFAPQGESQEYDASPSASKTIVAAPSLPPRSPKAELPPSPTVKKVRKPKEPRISSTVDEEEADSHARIFAEETHFLERGEMDTVSRRRFRKTWARRLIVFGGLIAVVVFTFWLGSLLGPIFKARKAPVQPSVTPVPVNTPSSTRPTPSPAESPIPSPAPETRQSPTPAAFPPPPKAEPAELRKISFESSVGFLKLTMEGPGIGRPTVSRLTNPRRLVLDFKNVKSFAVDPAVIVGVNPLRQIRTAKYGSGVQVTLDLYPADFPRYDIKERPNAVVVYLHR